MVSTLCEFRVTTVLVGGALRVTSISKSFFFLSFKHVQTQNLTAFITFQGPEGSPGVVGGLGHKGPKVSVLIDIKQRCSSFN